MFACLFRFLTNTQRFRSRSTIPQPSSDSAALSLISMFHVSACQTNHMATWELKCSRFLCRWFGQKLHAYLRSTRRNSRSTQPAQTALRKLLGHVIQTVVSPRCASDGRQDPSLDSLPRTTEHLQITHG